MTRIVVIAGVRPQYIKLAALQRGIADFNRSALQQIDAIYINSGQHYSDQLASAHIDELGVHFDFNMQHSVVDPTHMLANMIIGIYELIIQMTPKPDCVLVFGDASTTLAGAIAATRARYPVVHVEAGVRSGNLGAIEEVHRRVVSHISSIHLCSSKSAITNLAKENITQNVYWTGDIAYDFFIEYSNKQPTGIKSILQRDYILVTLHKATNFVSCETLANLMEVLSGYSRKVVFITHPKTRQFCEQHKLNRHPNITFLDSLPFGQMISAIKGSSFLVTDSGGLQREAYYLGKRCLVRRDSLGWSKLVDFHYNKLIGRDKQDILDGLHRIETAILSNERVDIDEFIRDHACQYALELLVALLRD